MDVYGDSHVSCLFIPSKIEILQKKMPDFAEQYSSEDIVKEVKKRLKSDARVSSLLETLRDHEDEYIFYRTDHHWTTLGAYYAYEAYKKMCKEKVPKLSEYTCENVYDDFLGTTYNRAHVYMKPDEVAVFHKNDEKKKIQIDENNGELFLILFILGMLQKRDLTGISSFFQKYG